MQDVLRVFSSRLVKSQNSIKFPFKNIGMNSAGAHSRNKHNFISVLSMQKFNVWLALRSTIHLMGKYIVLIVAAMARKYYQARNSILNQSNWMKNKTKLLWMMVGIIFILGCNLLSTA